MANFKQKAKEAAQRARIKIEAARVKAAERSRERDVKQQERATQERLRQKLKTQELEVQAEQAEQELGLIKRRGVAKAKIAETRQARVSARSSQLRRFQPGSVFTAPSSTGNILGGLSIGSSSRSRSSFAPSGRIDGNLFQQPGAKPKKRKKRRRKIKRRKKRR